MAVYKQTCDTSLYTENTTLQINVTKHPSVASPDILAGK
jgi:hypothetical protein